MKQCQITLRDEVWCTVTGLEKADNNFLWDKFGPYKDGFKFMPAYKLGRWDGRIRFFEKTGKTYHRLLPQILPYLDGWNYDIQLNDLRHQVGELPSPVSADVFSSHGINIRPYQIKAVNLAIEAGSGFIIAATGAGKSLITAALSHAHVEAGHTTVTVVPSADLVEQTYEWYQRCGLDVGRYSGSNKELHHPHVVATWQTLQNHLAVMKNFNAFIWDECFAPETKVLMNDYQWKAIKDINIDDKVISWNSDGFFETQNVEKIHKNLKKSKNDQMLKLTFENDIVICVTENHEFYTSNRGKVKAKDLNETDDILEFSINKMESHKGNANVIYKRN